MPKQSLESKIKEHQKYRSQCQVRIGSGIRLLLICLALEILLLVYKAAIWRLVLIVLVIISGSTLLGRCSLYVLLTIFTPPDSQDFALLGSWL